MALYYAPLGAQSVTNDSSQDLWVLAAPSDSAVKLHYAKMTSTVTSDERLLLSLIQRTTAGSVGGTALTVVALDGTSAAAGATVTPLVTTQGTPSKTFLTDYWSQLAPWEFLPTPAMQIIIPPSGFLALALATAVASTRSMSGWLVFEELG